MDGQGHSGGPDPRAAGLGALAVLPDELICFLLASLDVRDLLALGQASRLLRVFVSEEPLWLAKHLERCRTPFDYRVRTAQPIAPGLLGCIAAAAAVASYCPHHGGAPLACLQGSWRATYFAHHPACGRPQMTAEQLVPLAPVPGFSSPALYRCAALCLLKSGGSCDECSHACPLQPGHRHVLLVVVNT